MSLFQPVGRMKFDTFSYWGFRKAIAERGKAAAAE
jgi:hypothetical protein